MLTDCVLVQTSAQYSVFSCRLKQNVTFVTIFVCLPLTLLLSSSLCLSPRDLARWCRRHRHQRRMQVTWWIPAGLCWWLWQSALVLLPLLSTKGQTQPLTHDLLTWCCIHEAFRLFLTLHLLPHTCSMNFWKAEQPNCLFWAHIWWSVNECCKKQKLLALHHHQTDNEHNFYQVCVLLTKIKFRLSHFLLQVFIQTHLTSVVNVIIHSD